MADETCRMGVYCSEHNFIHGAEAEDLRERIEKLVYDASKSDRNVGAWELQGLLDECDARDSLVYREIQDGRDAEDEAESAPPPAESPLGQATCAGSYPGTIRDLARRLEVCVAEEQEQPLPRNHFIAVFCDVIRYMRDEGAKPFATVDQPDLFPREPGT